MSEITDLLPLGPQRGLGTPTSAAAAKDEIKDGLKIWGTDLKQISFARGQCPCVLGIPFPVKAIHSLLHQFEGVELVYMADDDNCNFYKLPILMLIPLGCQV